MHTRTVIDVYDNDKLVMQDVSIKDVIMSVNISRSSLYRCTKFGCMYDKRYRFEKKTKGTRYARRYFLYLGDEIVLENASIDHIAEYLGLASVTVYDKISKGEKLKKVYDWDEADLPKKLLSDWDKAVTMFRCLINKSP